MNREFDRVDAALASSLPGRAVSFLDEAIQAAWRNSSTGAMARSAGRALHDVPAAQLVRMIAMAVLIAVAMQPLLISAMPVTVAPAMPWAAYALEALFAAAAAWQAEAIVQAWPRSTLARWFRR